MSGRAAVPKSRAGETARRVKKASVLTGRIEHKDASYLPRRRRPNGVCTPVVLRGTTSFAAFGSSRLRVQAFLPPIRRPVTWAERPRATAPNGVHAGCSQVRADRTVLPPCTGMAALWAQGMRKVMSCSLHLPNDCVYFSPDFIICQYILGKLGDSSIFAAAKIRNFRRFLFKREMNKTEHNDR